MYSTEYLKQLQKLHSDSTKIRSFGGKVKKLGKFYIFLEMWKPESLLDYGCGKGHILENLKEKYPNIKFEGYDPAVERYNKILFNNFDCVFSNDVLEHIEPEYIDDVLTHINNLASKFIWLRIDTKPARKTLSDGRNAHILLRDVNWWNNKIKNLLPEKIVYQNYDSKGKLDLAIEK